MLRPEVLVFLIPLTALCIPIVAILTYHQRKMAELMHGQNGQNQELMVRELQSMRHELAELRERVNHQAIQMDDLSALRPGPQPLVSPRRD